MIMFRYCKLISAVLVVAGLFCICAAGKDTAPANAEVLRVRTTFNKELQKIDDEELATIIDAQSQHIAAMNALMEQLKRAGKGDSASAVSLEIERFSAAKVIEEKNLSIDVPELAKIQSGYIKAVGKMPLDKAAKIVKLAQNCEKALMSLQKTMTAKNDIEGALEAKNEIEALKLNKEVVSAESITAAARAATKEDLEQKPVVEKPKEKQPAVATVAKKDDKPKKKYTGTAEKRVRQRFDLLCDCVLKQDYKKASDYINPDYVKEQGDDRVRKQLSLVFPFVQFADDPHRKLSVDSVKMEDGDMECSLVPKLWAANKWHELGAMKWKEADGDWYLDVETSSRGVSPKSLENIQQQENRPGPKRFVPPRRMHKK